MTRRLLCALTPFLLGLPSPAHADDPPVAPTVVLQDDGRLESEPEPTPPREGGFSVMVRSPETVDPEALRTALQEDLGVRVEIVQPGEEGARVIVELSGDGHVRLRVRREHAPPLTRETPAHTSRDETTVTVSLLVANLVRDESADLLSLLEPPPAAPEAELESTPEPAVPPAEPEPSAPAPSAAPSGPESAPEPPWVPAGVDFVPGLGVSSAFLGDERRAFSLGVLAGLDGGVEGVAISSVLHLSLGAVHGSQTAGVYAHAHRVFGAQIGGVVAASEGSVQGLQVAGVIAAGGAVSGVQVAGVTSVSDGDFAGLQLSGVANLGRAVRGIQTTGVLNVASGRVYGAQLATINIATGQLRGLQLGVFNSAGDTDGLQQGLLNVASDVNGAQLGVVNIAGRVRGVQLGLLNISEQADVAIGLFSVHTRGHNHLRVEAGATGLLRTSFVHRGPATYSVLTASVNPFLGPTGGVGLGLGARAQLVDGFHLDFELIAHALFHGRATPGVLDGLFEARLIGGIEVTEGVSILIGAGFQTMFTSAAELSSVTAMPIAFDEPVGDTQRIGGWPTLTAGVELF